MSCRKTSEKLEKAKFQKLSVIEAYTLKFHLAMCKQCQDYQKYSAQLDELLKNEFGNEKIDESTIDASLTSEEKNQLIEKLKNH
jgi:predicted anti-sigma-YlaC factor YlaD